MGVEIRSVRGRRGRVSQARFRLAAFARHDGLWDHDLVTGRVWWNATYDRLFGPRPPETADSAGTNSDDWWRARLHPEDRAVTLASLHAALAGPGDSWSCTYRLIRPDGGTRHVLDRATILRGPDGNPTRILGSMLDLTAQNSLLESERLARFAAESASRTKDDLLARIAHELRTPIHAVLGWTHLIRRGAVGAELDRAIEVIERTAQFQARLISELVQFVREPGSAGSVTPTTSDEPTPTTPPAR